MSRILIEASPMTDQNKSGVGYFVERLISSLATLQNQYEIQGYYFNFLKMNKETLPQINGLKLHRIWLIPGKLISLFRRLGFQPYLEFFTKTDAEYLIFTNYVALPLLNKKIKKALIVYDMCFMDHPNYVQQVNLTYLNKFCPRSIKNANLIITNSNFTKSRIEYYFPNLKTPILVTPIPPVKKSIKAKTPSNRLKNLNIHADKYILCVGTVEPRKNIINLIKAYSGLGQNLQNKYSLVLAGGKGWNDEEIWKEIKNYQSKGLKIITTGYITEDEKDYLYRHAACFVLPSHYEGFGMPILEAMQYKIPSAISDIPVFREIAGEGALYFNKEVPDDIGLKINHLLTDSVTRSRLIDKALIQLKDYSWNKNVNNIVSALKEIS